MPKVAKEVAKRIGKKKKWLKVVKTQLEDHCKENYWGFVGS